MMLLISEINPDAVGGLLDSQEKNYQLMKSKRLAQELLFERERWQRLETELDTYHSEEDLLKSEIKRLDTALHKVFLNVTECFKSQASCNTCNAWMIKLRHNNTLNMNIILFITLPTVIK